MDSVTGSEEAWIEEVDQTGGRLGEGEISFATRSDDDDAYTTPRGVVVTLQGLVFAQQPVRRQSCDGMAIFGTTKFFSQGVKINTHKLCFFPPI